MNAGGSVKADLLTEDVAKRGEMRHPPRRPKDAASLLLIDRQEKTPRVLVGKRGKGHAFMPAMYVFPGGRRDAADNKTTLAQPLHGEVTEQLLRRTIAQFGESAARGLAVAAAREMMEEAHLSLTPADHTANLCPDVSPFRFLARAITPPGMPRRFDTRFFACFTDEVDADPTTVQDSDELQDLTWLPIDRHDGYPLPGITKVVLTDLQEALDADNSLPFQRKIPFYYYRNGRFVRELI
ncbi:NUDIX domain protein [Hoeflea phototrophica DFL-43]|uniref:NUDIX domain protein n=1 Tax=Hoeflea phototrophica (strain DSM 17068 / NCIMB 14078 / DFL-43) TaxID=411684 RepID=A9D529_HOEPD|nr:NUDIX hydrolase [Hoeflea phototrophica]EDQ34020.1 NUDIX domain protein [Hoeflea phototrophica DFL-43]